MSLQSARFDAALNNMSQGLCMADAEQRVIVCNNQYFDLFELSAERVKPGTPIHDLLDHGPSERSKGLLSAVLTGQQPLIKSGRKGSYSQDIADLTIAISHQPMPGGGWVATYADISERRRAEARIFHMAHHDALTDLPNRLLLHERMQQGFLRCYSNGTSFSLLCLDLDGFKSVNDTLGHPAGDELLRIVAERLRECVRETDLVARLGGDEFAILHTAPHASRDFDRFVRRVLETIEAPYDINGHQVVIGTSIGVAIAPRDGSDADQLFKNADLALYRAKADGRGTYRFFEQEMDIALQGRRALELDLRKALAAGEFELWYQPIVSLATKEVTGCEALLRWQHPERGMVSPADFIPLAEEIGLIVPIGEWVLRQACLQAASWAGNLRIAINLSPLQLKSRYLVQTVLVALSNSGLSPSRLELEITETVLLQDNENTLSRLHDLRHHGIRIALDDFGTGYSSLSYLRSFPFDKIKVDQSFVRDVVNRPDCMAIVESIANLGRNLGMTTTAEGIETEQQLSVLRDAGFLEGQGYYFSAPRSSPDLCMPSTRSEAA
jgi:diguanylate cyclase (GGDEF)-like protein